VFVRIPEIAKREWHPFTLSSAPEVDTLSIHVRSLGNWTSALRRHVEANEQAPLVAYLDGPYGSPSAHIENARFAVLIGAGIGVTPYASILESLVLRAKSGETVTLEKGHFFWLNKDQFSFEWFTDLLANIETHDTMGLLDIHLCMTAGRTGATALGLEVARSVIHDAGLHDSVTGLRTKTHMGHPDWQEVLTAIRALHAPHPVDVFFCGPRGLGAKIEKICLALRMPFHEEQF
jgi:NADPH oxidase 5